MIIIFNFWKKFFALSLYLFFWEIFLLFVRFWIIKKCFGKKQTKKRKKFNVNNHSSFFLLEISKCWMMVELLFSLYFSKSILEILHSPNEYYSRLSMVYPSVNEKKKENQCQNKIDTNKKKTKDDSSMFFFLEKK